MGFVLRKSLPSLSGLIGLLLAVGLAAVYFLDAPIWFPAIFAIVILGIQYLVNPYIIQWLVPATVIARTPDGYDTGDHPLGAIVARRCRDAGVPLVKLGLVDDGNPNAFTFGRTRRDARIWVTRGLLERLDERELDAVIAHEVGHIKHWDFAVMTVAAVIPMILFYVFLIARGSDREGQAIAIAAYVAYLVSQLTLLALSRARETAADHWSCKCTGDGDALASALVKIAYGMGQVSGAQREQVAALAAQGKEGKAAARKLERRADRAQSMRAMGIFEPKSAEAMKAAFANGIDPDRALGALRWDIANPWGRTLEKLSSHPLVARRIQALEQSGLPGAPRQWSVMRAMASTPPAQVAEARAGFAKGLFIALAPWVILIALVVFGVFAGSTLSIGTALVIAGALFWLKQLVRYPASGPSGQERETWQPVDEVASLLDRLDAGPVGGIPVELRGQIIGRGMPGYLLSPDLVIQDQSGFVPLLYKNPIPFAAAWFGLFRADGFLGQEVVARGWYHRLPGPAVELRAVVASDGRKARSIEWVARYVASAGVFAAGLVVLLFALTG